MGFNPGEACYDPSMKKGIFYTVVSALIFGVTPAMARLTFDGGANAVTITFLRAALALPLLALAMKVKGIPFATDRRGFRDLFLVGGMSSAITTVLLYLSYAYIPVGMATTLHYIYPVVVSASCVVCFGEKMTKPVLAALVLCMTGVALFSGKMDAGNATGVALALVSGFTLAFYMLFADKSTLRNEHFLKITFYISVALTVCAGTLGLVTGSLTFALTPKAWVYAWIVALSTSLGGIAFLQLGIKYAGAMIAAILSTFEPIASVVCGVLILGEEMSLLKAAGCACILVSVLLISFAGGCKPEQERTLPSA